MKILLASILLLATSFVQAQTSTPKDTLDVYSQYGHQHYLGEIYILDTEDLISQIEINNSTITADDDGGPIFFDGFEGIGVNWIWVGDDTNGVEFGHAAHCSIEALTFDRDANRHLVLRYCRIME